MTVLHDSFFVVTFSVGLVATIIGGLFVIVLIFELLVMALKQIAELVADLIFGKELIVDYLKNQGEYKRWKSQKEEETT